MRNAHALAYDGGRKVVVLFGGADVSRVRGDTWECEGKTWTRVSLAGPSPRTFPGMAYDSFRRRMVLFGGNRVLFGKDPTVETFLDDTWEWDGRHWSQIATLGPPPRAKATMAFDRGKAMGDTWEYDGQTWMRVSITGPAPRNHTAMTYDANRKRIILFGGHDGDHVFGDIWEWDVNKWFERAAVDVQKRVDNDH